MGRIVVTEFMSLHAGDVLVLAELRRAAQDALAVVQERGYTAICCD